MLELVWTIQLAPFLPFLIISLGGRGVRKSAPWLALTGAGIAVLSNAILFFKYLQVQHPLEWSLPWIQTSSMKIAPFLGLEPPSLSDISVGFLVDPINLLMLTVVTIVSFFVQMFSVFYMSEDGDKPRYFGFLSLFSFSMIGIVLSSNLLQTFMFWELVGLTSYLLIGFWFEKKSASDAARKAFMINRLADLGFFIAIVFLFLTYGSLDLSALQSPAISNQLPLGLVTVIGILIFLGIAGKSAQFPFHVWLPDAMEGPTPVSALIHSATMVAAGVFLLARIFPIFAASQTTLWVILVVGTITSLLSATIACVQTDIKRILAYSTISQLGLMVMGIASGAWVAGLFHLTTHAFFKSLLFLTAGALIHHSGSNDIFIIGQRGAKKNKFMMLVLGFGLFSLCGIPPFSGFFSKDAILHSLKEGYPLFYAAGLLVTFFTALYSFRMLFILLNAKVIPR
ncbi:NADH-quinone oxidoreductase subunit L, partial [Patescibacteria group bacterium]|nr:NADH-quinone oxidoreductase subunit L [Patescibacteria group bacterium]